MKKLTKPVSYVLVVASLVIVQPAPVIAQHLNDNRGLSAQAGIVSTALTTAVAAAFAVLDVILPLVGLPSPSPVSHRSYWPVLEPSKDLQSVLGQRLGCPQPAGLQPGKHRQFQQKSGEQRLLRSRGAVRRGLGFVHRIETVELGGGVPWNAAQWHPDVPPSARMGDM